MATPTAASMDQLIVVKIALHGGQNAGENRKIKLPLKSLNAQNLPGILREILKIPAGQHVTFERFSDSSGAFLTLDPANPATYKQLYRAAKAKLKLRLRVTLPTADTISPLLKEILEQKPVIAETTASPSKAVDGPKPLPEVLQLRPKPMAAPMSIMNPPKETSIKTEAVEKVVETDTPKAPIAPATFWQVFCNNCDKGLSDAHFHCGICDKGDYDLCEACVNSGKLCEGEGHWLIKRFVKNGKMTNSTTERIAPRTQATTKIVDEVESIVNEVASIVSGVASKAPREAATKKVVDTRPTRTCNNCVRSLPENILVECQTCDDFDLCWPCLSSGVHGHHPAHAFKILDPNADKIPQDLAKKCQAGGNVQHAAICDGCDNKIIGMRHKCLDCPDWDYCTDCNVTAEKDHPGHRFVPLYSALQANYLKATDHTIHYNIYCDGPLCKNKAHQSYIRGPRYKCTICHDTDFCDNCEAHPKNKHNTTHPTIKFKTHIRGVAITTTGDDGQGQRLPVMGDLPVTAPATVAVQNLRTLRETNPSTETLPAYTPEAAPATTRTQNSCSFRMNRVDMLDAHFTSDVIVDGTRMSPGQNFTQTWTLRNPGPQAWPLGCTVRSVGGDDMLAIDRSHPFSADELHNAARSNPSTTSVPSGGEASFTVNLYAPAREGKHISYWRLHNPEGVPFGHKLWCDIETKTLPVLVTAPAALREPSQEATAAADKAWKHPAAIQPSPVGPYYRPAGRAPFDPVRNAEATAALPIQPGLAPVMPSINNAARFGTPHQMRLRAMELQNRHRLLREQWKNGQGASDREKATAEWQQLQASMQPAVSASGPTPQAPVTKENQEMQQLMSQQQARREQYISMSDGMAKEQAKRSNVHLDNQEMNQLIMQQRMRRQHMLAALRPRSSVTPDAVGSLARAEQATMDAVASGAPPAVTKTAYQLQREALLKAQASLQQTRMRQQAMQMEAMQMAQASTAQQSKPAVAAKAPTSTMPTQVKPKAPTVEDIEPANESILADAPMQKSEMVFPKLEKESPTSSVELKSESAATAPSAPMSEKAVSEAAPSTAVSQAPSVVSETTAADDIGEDFESVAAEDVEVYDDAQSGVHSDDDGFDTDEYDILDASDEEALEAAKNV